MADEYTPTTEQVRQFWASEGRYIPAAKNYGIAAGRAEFDRWLAAHDADLTARLAAAEATIAEALTSARQGDYSFRTIRILSAYQPVAAHPTPESETK